MGEMLVPVLLGVAHLVVCVIWFFGGKIARQEAVLYLPLVVLLPVTGVICAAILSRRVSEEVETPISKLYRIVEKDLMSVNAGRPELDNVVPFDEVLLLSDDQMRREVMMHILRRDPFLYLEVLKAAKVSSDVEVTHYATTTIMEIQRDLDIAMQKAEEGYNAEPSDIDAVNRYISALSSYINTGLLLENRMVQLRRQLSKILEHKLSIFPNSRSAHLLLIETSINLGNYSRAEEIATQMREKWPNDEASWLKSLHVCMASGDAEKKSEIASRLKEALVHWSRAGKQEVEFICGN